jgi:hypothetical protein
VTITAEAEEVNIGSSALIGPIGYRRLVESQGSRSQLYELKHRGTTDEATNSQLNKPFLNIRPTLRQKTHKNAARHTIAEREHVSRLLRSGQATVALLKHAEDRTEAASYGARLCEILEQLWEFRLSREDDWIEILNLLQIVLREENFQEMQISKKNALTVLFRDALVSRSIGPFELRKAVRILKDGGFNLWRGIEAPVIDYPD